MGRSWAAKSAVLGDRSLLVAVSVSSPWGFVAHSSCGDDFFQCRDHVAKLLQVNK
jgi:hypothetical protein